MTIHFRKELDQLKKKILYLGVTVEDLVRDAVKSLVELDADLAREVIKSDQVIDEKEVEIEEDCLKLLALHNPVAADLRFVISTLKINNDLERVGDLAVNIAERAKFLSKQPRVEPPTDFAEMAQKTLKMIRNSLDSFVDLDVEKSHQVCTDDKEIDDINRGVYKKVYAGIKDNVDHSECLIHYLSVSRHLERVADYATNISEDVIYMVEGRIVRHSPEEFES